MAFKRSGVRLPLAPPAFALRASAGKLKPPGAKAERSDEHVYLLESIDWPEQIYVGLMDDLRARITAHNSSQSIHTSKFNRGELSLTSRFQRSKRR
jgi:hypothetical protein